MTDIHGMPSESMMTPVQGFTSEPLPDLAAMTQAAEQLAGPGGPRQSMAETLLTSPQGYGEQDIDAGWSGVGDDGWPANVEPPGM